MKKNLLALFTLILLVGTSCQEKIDIEKEKEAIKAVIEEQTNAFTDRDLDRIAATHVNDETFIRLAANKDGYYYVIGWEDRRLQYEEIFKNNPDTLLYKFVNTNYKIKVYSESAWAVYDETWYDSEGESLSMNLDVRFLEKINGEWKIAYLGVVNTTSYEEDDTEVEGEPETEDTE